MNAPLDSDPIALEGRILEYLDKHPDAADNLEGIAAWWLGQTGYPFTTKAVQEALSRLVADHRIARIELPDGRTLYQSVNKVSGPHPILPQPNP